MSINREGLVPAERLEALAKEWESPFGQGTVEEPRPLYDMARWDQRQADARRIRTILAEAREGGKSDDAGALNAIYSIATRALAESHKEDTRALVEICDICEGTPPQCICGAKKGEWHKQECAVNPPPPSDLFCDDCMMRDMTESEGNAHHASTGHSVFRNPPGDPSLRDAVADVFGEIVNAYEVHSRESCLAWADRILALFEGAGGLRAYAQHLPSCDLENLVSDEHPTCTCGFEAALRASPPPAEPVGLGTFARTAAIIATLEPAEPGLREEDLRRLAIYSVATCDINGGNKRDRPAILLEQAIAALALVEGEKK